MTQADRLKAYLEIHGRITPKEAWERLGIYRLSARIYDLKRQGVDIDVRMVTVPVHGGDTAQVAEYFIPQKQGALF